MTIIEAISYIDNIKPNGYAPSEKVRWLSLLDGKVHSEIISTHEGAPEEGFAGYTDETPQDTQLLIPHPYDDIYPLWLEAQIDYANGEYTHYNNSMEMFNTAYAAYERGYNRTHMPVGRQIKFF